MTTRIITSVIGLPFLIAIVLFGGVYLQIASAIISIVGMYELYKAISKEIKPIHYIGFIVQIIYSFFIYKTVNENFRLALIFFVLVVLMMLVLFYGKINVLDASVTLFGFVYVGLMFSCIPLVRAIDNIGQTVVWLIFICAFASDTGAYFIGINFGKHKMTPVLSPKKSIEGAVGGVVSSVVVSIIFAIIINYISNIQTNVLMIAFIGAIGSVFAQMGDLTASSIKRYVGIKDYGNIIPGHGGIMDRFDSVLFTAPAVYIAVLISVNITY